MTTACPRAPRGKKKNNNNTLILAAKTRRKIKATQATYEYTKFIYLGVKRRRFKNSKDSKIIRVKTEADELFFFLSNYLENVRAYKADTTYTVQKNMTSKDFKRVYECKQIANMEWHILKHGLHWNMD